MKFHSTSTAVALLIVVAAVVLLLSGPHLRLDGDGFPLLILVVPALLALPFALFGWPVGVYGSLPVFLFWLLVSSGFFWGFSQGGGGAVVTWFPFALAIAVCSIWGAISAVRAGAAASVLGRVLGVAVFAALQAATVGWLWISGPHV